MTQPGGTIYAIRASHPTLTKIGVALAALATRVQTLQISNPEPLQVLVAIPVPENARRIERCLHKLLANVHRQGEWFDLPVFTVEAFTALVTQAQEAVAALPCSGDEDDHIGARIRQIRQQQEMSQRTLARRAGISWQALNHLEHGRIRDPRVNTLNALVYVLGVSVSTLLDGMFAP